MHSAHSTPAQDQAASTPAQGKAASTPAQDKAASTPAQDLQTALNYNHVTEKLKGQRHEIFDLFIFLSGPSHGLLLSSYVFSLFCHG